MRYRASFAAVLAAGLLAGAAYAGGHKACCDACTPEKCCDTCPKVKCCKLTQEQVNCLIADLQSCCEKTRKAAAKELGKLDLDCYPEIECALAKTLLGDCAKCVRLAAASSLRRLGACGPCAKQAYQHAIDCDSCLLVDLHARLAKRKCPKECEVCSHCGCGAGAAPLAVAPAQTSLAPIVTESVRYEPKIRDMRALPAPTTLPGGAMGQRETLPVLPARENGLFLVPVVR